MYEPKGKIIESTSIGSLVPAESLFEFGGEDLTYVAHGPDDDLLLVHNLCAAAGVSCYLVSAIDAGILRDLKTGRLDIYSALRRPRCWNADLEVDGSSQLGWRIRALYRIDFDSVPGHQLLLRGAMITPELDAQFGGSQTWVSDRELTPRRRKWWIWTTSRSVLSGLQPFAGIGYNPETGQMPNSARRML